MSEEKCKHKYNGKCMPFECICNLAKGEQCQLLFMEAENKQLREALEKIKFEAEFNGNDESVQKIFGLAKQALGE